MDESHDISSLSRINEGSNPQTLASLPQANRSGLNKNDYLNEKMNGRQRQTSEAIDADALSKALKEFEEAGQVRERTPIGSPHRKRQRVYGDRLVTKHFLVAAWEKSRHCKDRNVQFASINRVPSRNSSCTCKRAVWSLRQAIANFAYG